MDSLTKAGIHGPKSWSARTKRSGPVRGPDADQRYFGKADPGGPRTKQIFKTRTGRTVDPCTWCWCVANSNRGTNWESISLHIPVLTSDSNIESPVWSSKIEINSWTVFSIKLMLILQDLLETASIQVSRTLTFSTSAIFIWFKSEFSSSLIAKMLSNWLPNVGP